MKPAWKMMPTGRMVDLVRPGEAVLDWSGDIAPALAHIARFDGACAHKGRAWTVLDHLVSGHDIIRTRAGDRLAALWLLHDVHEAYLGDITSPVQAALAGYATNELPDKAGYPAGHYVAAAIKGLKAIWDAAIWRAAGIAPPDREERDKLHHLDLMMLMTERRQMMPPPAHGWGHLEKLPSLPTPGGALTPCPRPDRLVDAFLDRLDARCPAARMRTAATDLEPFTATARRA
jgi:uncharacterized protein